MDISQNIKRIRESKGMTQAVVAELLDMDRANYSRVEKRGEKLTIEQIQSISNALEVPLGEILDTGSEPTAINGAQIKILEKRVGELEELADTLRASERKYADFVGVLFHRIDWTMLVVAYKHSFITDKELGSHLVRDEYEGKETANIQIPRADNFPNYESYTSQLMTQEQIFKTLPFLNAEYSHDYQTLIRLYQSGLLPDDILKKALDNRLTAGYWGVQTIS